MATLLDELLLPVPFDNIPPADLGAWIEYGRRKLCWTLRLPGVLYRNAYDFAWVEVSEGEAWKGEPLRLWAMRRPPGTNSAREHFTDAGRKALHDLLVPVIAAYGFNRLWNEAHSWRTRPTSALAMADEARREVAWWDTKAALDDMHHAGMVTFRPVVDDHTQRAVTVPVLMRGAHPAYKAVLAEAFVDGEHVGWMVDPGELVPDRSILEPAAAPSGKID